MRPYVFIFAVLFLFACHKAQKNSLKDYNLNGSVKIISNRIYKARYIGGQLTEGEDTVEHSFLDEQYEYRFDPEGFLLTIRSGDLTLNKKDSFEYRDGKVYRRYEWRNTIKLSDYSDTVKKSTTEYEYENGRLLKTITRNENGEFETSAVFTTNPDGRLHLFRLPVTMNGFLRKQGQAPSIIDLYGAGIIPFKTEL